MEINGTESKDMDAGISHDTVQHSPMQGVFLPILILIISVFLLFGWQLYVMKAQTSIWKKQITQREQMVNQARAVQSDLQRIASDLVVLAATDKDAMAIVERYQIKHEPEPSSSAPRK